VIDVNLTGAFFGLRAAADVMVQQGRGGRIINVASQAAKSGFAHAQALLPPSMGRWGWCARWRLSWGRMNHGE
jgi:NAD(P)-dependent dehydrogenase (short-subunit alcohol dehydrogenase family)